MYFGDLNEKVFYCRRWILKWGFQNKAVEFDRWLEKSEKEFAAFLQMWNVPLLEFVLHFDRKKYQIKKYK